MRHDLARRCLATHALLTDKELPKLLSAWGEAWLHDPRNRVDHRQLLIVRSKIARKQLRGEWDSLPADGLVNKNPRTKFWLNLLLIVLVQKSEGCDHGLQHARRQRRGRGTTTLTSEVYTSIKNIPGPANVQFSQVPLAHEQYEDENRAHRLSIATIENFKANQI